MRIRTDEATAAQLRQHYREATGGDIHPTATRENVLMKLRERDLDPGEEFELKGEAPDEAEDAPKEVDRDALVQALVQQGYGEAQARDLAGATVETHRRDLAANGEPAYGPGKEDLYVTVRIDPGQEKNGKVSMAPAFLVVNGERIDVPRGIDWPIRTPFLEALEHAEVINYQLVQPTPDDEPRLIPHYSKAYPFQLLTPVPYDKAHAAKVAEKAQATLAERVRAAA